MNIFKNSLKFAFVLTAFVALASCGGGEASGDNSPSGVATNFLTAVSNGDFDDAKAYVTDDTQEAVDDLETFAGDDVEGLDYTVVGETIDGDYATVEYSEATADGNNTLSMVKDGDDWKIEFDKIDFTGGEEETDLGDIDFDLDSDDVDVDLSDLDDLSDELENLSDDLEDLDLGDLEDINADAAEAAKAAEEALKALEEMGK